MRLRRDGGSVLAAELGVRRMHIRLRRICCATCTVLALQSAVTVTLSAQQTNWSIVGDTSGAPRGCGAAPGVAALNKWFVAFGAADSAALDQATAHRFVFSN